MAENKNNGQEAEMQKVMQEITLLSRKLDKLIMAGQTITVNIPSTNLIDLVGRKVHSQIIITKPIMNIMVDLIQ